MSHEQDFSNSLINASIRKISEMNPSELIEEAASQYKIKEIRNDWSELRGCEAELMINGKKYEVVGHATGKGWEKIKMHCGSDPVDPSSTEGMILKLALQGAFMDLPHRSATWSAKEVQQMANDVG